MRSCYSRCHLETAFREELHHGSRCGSQSFARRFPIRRLLCLRFPGWEVDSCAAPQFLRELGDKFILRTSDRRVCDMTNANVLAPPCAGTRVNLSIWWPLLPWHKTILPPRSPFRGCVLTSLYQFHNDGAIVNKLFRPHSGRVARNASHRAHGTIAHNPARAADWQDASALQQLGSRDPSSP
jgi:hypothetical protein